jgi:DNA-binding XRE family transcriptional regulator
MVRHSSLGVVSANGNLVIGVALIVLKEPDTVPWTADQDALLGTAPDAEVARRLGRTLSAVYTRRHNLVDGRVLRRLRLKVGLTQAALAKVAGVHRAKPGALETGRERSLPRAALERMAAALGWEAKTLIARDLSRKPNRPGSATLAGGKSHGS